MLLGHVWYMAKKPLKPFNPSIFGDFQIFFGGKLRV